MAQKLGIEAFEVPAIPGDVALCGELPKAVVVSVARRYKSWVYLDSADHPCFFPEAIRTAGALVVLRPFPGPLELPSGAEAAALLQAVDALPRPLMLQCASGDRAGAALLLWLAHNRGCSAESARQLATDIGLKFWVRGAQFSPMRDWLLARLPAQDEGSVTKSADGLIFAQLFDAQSSSFTYLLGCDATREAVLIDPVLEQKDRDLALLRELGLRLNAAVDTHVHADHISSAGAIRRALLPDVRTVISRASGARADMRVDEGDEVAFGRFALEALATPGHTGGCTSWLLRGSRGMVFTGDALLIRGCGRTDLQHGDPGRLYESVRSKLFGLSGSTSVYPGHDWKGRNVSTVDEERRFNLWFAGGKKQLVRLMSELRLPHPRRMHDAVPANMAGGVAC